MDIIFLQLSTLASQNTFLACIIIYIGVIFLGNIGAFAGLWFAFQGGLGEFGILLAGIAAFCANVTGDILWYSLGRKLHSTRIGNWIKRRFPNHEKFNSHIEQKGPRWMLFAKFAYGSNFPVLFSLGWARMDFKKFFRRSLLAITIWFPIILGISYALYSSLSPLLAIATIKHFEILFLAGLIFFIALQYAISRLFVRFLGQNRAIDK